MGAMRGGVRSIRAEQDTVVMVFAADLVIVSHAIRSFNPLEGHIFMNSIVYIVGAVVIILAILGFVGLR
jgi:hypothetical protein